MTLLRMTQAAHYTGLHPHTLRKYIDRGVLHGQRLGAQRYSDTGEGDTLMGCSLPISIDPHVVVIYARVSTRKQQENLKRQSARLQTYGAQQGLVPVAVVEEIASGVNEQRRGLGKVLLRIRQRKVAAVIIEYKDRLARFGYNYLKDICEDSGVKITVIDREEHSPEEELVTDLIAIVTSFSARIYGRRGAKTIVDVIRQEVRPTPE